MAFVPVHTNGIVLMHGERLEPAEAEALAARLRDCAADANLFRGGTGCPLGRHFGPFRPGAGGAFTTCARCGSVVDPID